MHALLVVDVQNEFSPDGLRAVPNHADAIRAILAHVADARANDRPIAWIQHFNKPAESRAFLPGSWGSELSPEMGAMQGRDLERHFTKDVFGAFTYTGLEEWLRSHGVTSVTIVGFFAHMCVSTSAREALVRGFDVVLDPDAVGSADLNDAQLGSLSGSEVVRSALLQLVHMGATLHTSPVASEPRYAAKVG